MSILVSIFFSQENPELEYAGWKRISSMPELNFLSQIVMLLFEDESKPVDSSCRYYMHLHIGCGVKARKQTFSDGVPFIDGETPSPSFVKRLPTIPVHRETPSTSKNMLGVRKIASYPILHNMDTVPMQSAAHSPPAQRSASNLFFIVTNGSPTKVSPDSPGRKLSIGYTDESLQTLGVPGENMYKTSMEESAIRA